jgi:hypothetical protein
VQERERESDLAQLNLNGAVKPTHPHKYKRHKTQTDVDQVLHNSVLRRVPLVPQILAPFLRAVGALSDGRLEEAFQHHKEAFMCVLG